MIIDGVKKRKSGTITINYTEGGKVYGLSLTPREIVELYTSRPTKRAVDLATDSHCPDCGAKLTWCAECEKRVTPNH